MSLFEEALNMNDKPEDTPKDELELAILDYDNKMVAAFYEALPEFFAYCYEIPTAYCDYYEKKGVFGKREFKYASVCFYDGSKISFYSTDPKNIIVTDGDKLYCWNKSTNKCLPAEDEICDAIKNEFFRLSPFAIAYYRHRRYDSACSDYKYVGVIDSKFLLKENKVKGINRMEHLEKLVELYLAVPPEERVKRGFSLVVKGREQYPMGIGTHDSSDLPYFDEMNL